MKPDSKIKMKSQNMVTLGLIAVLLLNSCKDLNQLNSSADMKNMMIRISEIEIDTNFLEEYNAILQEESRASVMLEPGVISIFPMYQSDHPAQLRILEVYANKEAYESHLKTPHFQKYKTTTLKMVKSLKLIDMEAIDEETMPRIFGKIKETPDKGINN